jgi:predicted ribonuclease YlaK
MEQTQRIKQELGRECRSLRTSIDQLAGNNEQLSSTVVGLNDHCGQQMRQQMNNSNI